MKLGSLANQEVLLNMVLKLLCNLQLMRKLGFAAFTVARLWAARSSATV